MNKRFISFFLVFALLAALLPAGFAAGAEETAGEYGNYITGPHIVRSAASVSVMLTGAPRDAKDPEAWKKEIRVFALDPDTGLFENGEGREPADETKWVQWRENGYGYTVQLLKPGKYMLSGVPYYVLDPAVESHAALLDELEATADKCHAKTEKTTGTNLYKWLQKRVKAKVPEELAEVCKDPLNALLTGYAAREAYAPLLCMILSLEKIRAIPVDGKKTAKDGETDWVWDVCELDGEWLYADPALDAGKASWFAKDEAAMRKDHILSEEAEIFVERFLRSAYIDVLLRGDNELEPRLRHANGNEGYSASILFIDGPLYSIGPSEAVTMHFYSTYDDSDFRPEAYGAGWKENVVSTYFYQRLDWNTQFKYFYDPLPKNEKDYFRSRDIVEGRDVEILAYDPEAGTVTAKFKTPGLYKFFREGDFFCVLDPDDPEQAEIARLLDEARGTVKGSTDRETAKLLQDWEASKLKYDYEAFRLIKKWNYGLDDPGANDVYTDEIGMQEDASQDAFSGLISGCAVCGGYSNLYSLLLRNAGIPAFQVGGYLRARNMGHAWNILRLDGQWLYADPTWDDVGKTSASRYFCGTYAQYVKHHDEFGGKDTLVAELFENTVYEVMAHRFDTRYGVRLELPEVLRVLPGDVSGYPFPQKDPVFFKFAKFAIDDDHIEYGFGSNKVALASCKLNMRGESWETFDDDETRLVPQRKEYRYFKGMIYELKVQDYPGNMKPDKKPSIRQEYVWARTVLEEAKLSYSVPMKRNEIKGYSEKSSRTFTYDPDMNKKAMSWELEKDGSILAVTARFDENGKTDRVSVLLTPPSGGNGIGWETDRAGRITSLRVDDGDDTYLLEDMTETWLQTRQEVYRRSVLRKYPALSDTEPLPEGVHLYRFSKDYLVTVDAYLYFNRPNMYGGEAIATKDELFIWDEEGHLQPNPDARDLNDRPISIQMGENMDLSMATQLLITE